MSGGTLTREDVGSLMIYSIGCCLGGLVPIWSECPWPIAAAMSTLPCALVIYLLDVWCSLPSRRGKR